MLDEFPVGIDHYENIQKNIIKHTGPGFGFILSNDKKFVHIYLEDDGFYTYDKTIDFDAFNLVCNDTLTVIKMKKKEKKKGKKLETVYLPYPFGGQIVHHLNMIKDTILKYMSSI